MSVMARLNRSPEPTAAKEAPCRAVRDRDRDIQRRVAQHFAAPHPRASRADPAYLCFGCDTGRHDRTAFCVSCGEETDAYPAAVMS